MTSLPQKSAVKSLSEIVDSADFPTKNQGQGEGWVSKDGRQKKPGDSKGDQGRCRLQRPKQGTVKTDVHTLA